MSTVVMTLALPESTGAPRMARFFAEAFARRGHQVVLAHGPDPAAQGSGHGKSILDSMRETGAHTVPVPALAFPLTSAAPRQVAKLAVKHSALSVIGFQQRDRAVALKAARLAGVPGVVSAQNQHSFRGVWPVRLLKRWVYQRAVRNLADLIICPSEAVRQELIDSFGVDRGRTALVPNGVDVHTFPCCSEPQRTRIRAEFDVHDGELMLVSIGRIDTQKGYDVLLRAVEQCRKDHGRFKLVIAGGVSNGPTRPQMERHWKQLKGFVEEHGLQSIVRFAGWRDDCPLLLRSADAYVHAARWEGWPLAVVEAMSAELPVVTTDCAGRPIAFVDGQHGWVVPTADSEALSRGISNILQLTSAQRLAMGRASRALALEHYEIRKLGQKFVSLVEQLQQRRTESLVG